MSYLFYLFYFIIIVFATTTTTIILLLLKILFVLGFSQSCRRISTSPLRQQEGILILFLFLFSELNSVKVLFRFVRPL